MKTIVLASHGRLAEGLLDTLGMIVGQVENVFAFTLLRDDPEPIADKVRACLTAAQAADKNQELVVLTDMVGSSVNNDMVGLLSEFPQVKLVSGMNLPLLLGLYLDDTTPLSDVLPELIAQAAAGIVDCGAALAAQDESDGDDLLD